MPKLRLSQRVFETNHFRRLTKQRPDVHFKLCNRYLDQKPRSGRKFDVEAALGTVALSDALDAGVNLDVVLQRVDHLVVESLINLALETYPWPTDGDLEIAEQLNADIQGLPSPMRRRKIEELLNIYERPAKRFLILDANKIAKTTNDIVSYVDSHDGLPFWTIHSKRLIQRVLKFSADPLFKLERF